MHFSKCLIVFLVDTCLAISAASLLQSRDAACSTTSGNGTCISTTSCNGTSVSGYCSGPSDIKCCVRTCNTPVGPGFCGNTSSTCSGGYFIPGHCPGPADIECCVATCSTSTGNGFCAWAGSPCIDGSFVASGCPGPADIECCVAACSTPSGNGTCEYTSNGCTGGTFVDGYCPGTDNYECCVGGSDAPPPLTGLPGIDISQTPSASFWSCAAASYQVIAIEGYIQGCSIGGEVKSNFVSNYNSAIAAGFSRVDAYLFPCTGTQDNGVACKDPSTQLSEFLAAIDNNNMTLDHLWLDIEPTSTAAGDACNAWNLGDSANQALAEQWVSVLEGSGRNWGIYANANQWTTMFASLATDIGSQLPLWAVQDDNEPGVNTVDRFMGGWTSAAAKQYSLGATACNFAQEVDLDSFL